MILLTTNGVNGGAESDGGGEAYQVGIRSESGSMGARGEGWEHGSFAKWEANQFETTGRNSEAGGKTVEMRGLSRTRNMLFQSKNFGIVGGQKILTGKALRPLIDALLCH